MQYAEELVERYFSFLLLLTREKKNSYFIHHKSFRSNYSKVNRSFFLLYYISVNITFILKSQSILQKKRTN